MASETNAISVECIYCTYNYSYYRESCMEMVKIHCAGILLILQYTKQLIHLYAYGSQDDVNSINFQLDSSFMACAVFEIANMLIHLYYDGPQDEQQL